MQTSLLIESRPFEYDGIWPHQKCRCFLDVYSTKIGKICVVTELNDNPGASVTNCIEKIAAKLHSEYGDHVLIEHYGAQSYDFPRKEDYSLVRFSGEFCNPKWHTINDFDKYLETLNPLD